MCASSDLMCLSSVTASNSSSSSSNGSGSASSQQHEMICFWFWLLITAFLLTALSLVLSFTPIVDNMHYLSCVFFSRLSFGVHTMYNVHNIRCFGANALDAGHDYRAFGVSTLTSLHKIPQTCWLSQKPRGRGREKENKFCRTACQIALGSRLS